jgi:hypothetical protein
MFFGLVVLAISLLISYKEISAQEICVIPEQKVHTIEGTVSFFADENRVMGARVRLRRDHDDTIVSETETAEDGSFQLKGRYKGKYILIVSRPNAVSLYIPLRIIKQGSKNYLHILLGSLFNEPCGGGKVKLVGRK